MTEEADPPCLSLGELFTRAKGLYEKIASGDIAGPEERAKVCDDCQGYLERLQHTLASGGVFSPNEEIEEIATSDLCLLSVEFYLGSLLLRSPFTSPSSRLAALDRAEALLSHYITRCCELDILKGAEKVEWEVVLDEGLQRTLKPEEAREKKILQFQRLKAARARMDELAAAISAGEGGGVSGLGRDESLERERAIVVLQIYAREARDEIGNVAMEKEMVKHMALREGSEEGSSSRMARGTENSQGLQVTHVTKAADGQFQMKKEVFKANIFKPTVALPTMTVEEWGEIEFQEAMARAEREKNAPQPDRRYDQLEKDGDEDDPDLVDKANQRDREWDDWKDDHPRGMGNKANKRF